MLMIEVVANSMLVVVAMVLCMTQLNRLLQRAVEFNMAKTAAVEAAHLDDELRRLDRD